MISKSLCDHSCAGIHETFFKGIARSPLGVDDDDVDDDFIWCFHIFLLIYLSML
jgi:hypothetical protein